LKIDNRLTKWPKIEKIGSLIHNLHSVKKKHVSHIKEQPMKKKQVTISFLQCKKKSVYPTGDARYGLWKCTQKICSTHCIQYHKLKKSVLACEQEYNRLQKKLYFVFKYA
jgi:hypothetical protein